MNDLSEKKRFYYKAKVTKVIDGDTVDLEIKLGFNIIYTERFRLWGINSPESRSANLQEKELGEKAKLALESLLFDENGSKEVLVHTVKKEKFGRILAELFVDELNIGQELIKMGLAREYFGERRVPWFSDEEIHD